MNKVDTTVIGIHYGHDATVVLVKNGKILEAMQEERLSRIKKYSGFPHLSLAYIKEKYKLSDADLTMVSVVGENTSIGHGIFRTLKDNIDNRNNPSRTKHYLRSLGFTFPFLGKLILARDSYVEKKYLRQDISPKVEAFLKVQFPLANINYIHHHDAHAWAAIPFIENHSKKRLIFTLDGAGDDASGSVSLYKNGKMSLLVRFPIKDSLGLLYSAVVDLLGMKRNEHEFKVMGLAPYAKVESGEKVYLELRKIIWFDVTTMKIVSDMGTVYATAFFIAKEFSLKYRFDSIAYGIQKLTEELVQEMVIAYIKKYSISDIAIGGGVFMNVKANQKILELKEVTSLVSVPSCGDESLAIGAAIKLYIDVYGLKSVANSNDIYWGSEYSDEMIKKEIDSFAFTKKCSVEYFDINKGTLIERKIAELLASNSVVGRFSGRSEWGARALGNRSILANPSSKDNVKLINEMIKNRDFWMPFATSIRVESMHDYLIIKKEINAPYMSITYDTKEKAHRDIIAAIHPYDQTSRPQIVSRIMNEKYHNLITEFNRLTGIGGILNTSFNLHGEPNVESPLDALKTFENSGLLHLAIGNYLISKTTIEFN